MVKMNDKPDTAKGGGASLDFGSFIKEAKAFSRADILNYSPVDQATRYVAKAVRLEKHWEDNVRKARDMLLQRNAAELYQKFFDDLAGRVNGGALQSPLFARTLENVAYNGFGMSREHLRITPPKKGGARYRVSIDADKIKARLEESISGGTFLRTYEAKNAASWRGRAPRVAGSDVSQHTSEIPVPGRFFQWTAPIVLNNAAGVLRSENGEIENLFNPRPDDELLRWMLIDPSYWEEMDPPDYRQCLTSAMDVGQYAFELDYLLRRDTAAADVIFRDGSLFPQDAYADNYVLDGRRGEFVRRAIQGLLACFSYAKELTSMPLYCGVVKSVQLKMFSALMDWFIADSIDSDWDFSGYTLNDGTAMNILLSHPSYRRGEDSVVGTCLIRRSFSTRANLNRKVPSGNLEKYLLRFEEEHPHISMDPFKSLCEIGNLQMFFLGHSASPQQMIPRYEFFHHPRMGEPVDCAASVLAAVQHDGLSVDSDHSHMSKDTIEYLIPTATFTSHEISKKVGEYIDRETGAKIMSRIQTAISG